MSWWLILLAVLAAGLYAYSVSSQIKVAKAGCSSCPKKQNEDSTPTPQA